MAGGMRRSQRWGTMADRTGASASAPGPAPEGPAVRRPPPAPAPSPAVPGSLPVKPCWVTDRHGRLPGLLLQWRRTDQGFEGRVVRTVPMGEDWLPVEEWLPAACLEPGALT